MSHLGQRHALTVVAWNGLMLILTAVVFTPLWWMATASLTPTGKALSLDAALFPSEITFEHYRALFARLQMGRFALNSAFVSISVTAVSLVLNSMAGYALAKLNFPGRAALFRLVIVVLVIPIQVAMLPLFLLLKQMHLINSYWALVLPAAASAYGIFLIRQYALSVPDAMLDAARIDGASELRIFCQMVLPTIVPVLIAMGVFTFLATWNDFMWPLVVLTKDDSYTLPVALAILSGQHVQDVELMMAGAVVTALPVILVFLALQKHLIGGIVLGVEK